LVNQGFNPEATVADAGSSLRAGQAQALPNVPCQGDILGWFKSGSQFGVAGVDARRATPADPRPPYPGLAACRQLDPSHPALVTCEVGEFEPCHIVPLHKPRKPPFSPVGAIRISFPRRDIQSGLSRLGEWKSFVSELTRKWHDKFRRCLPSPSSHFPRSERCPSRRSDVPNDQRPVTNDQ
jgi:hypothetical protein